MVRSFPGHISSCLQLGRMRVSLFAACSAVSGYLMAGGADASTAVTVGMGIFLLACGASALNQYQERGLDARMARTCCRPLPSGRMRPRTAVLFAVVSSSLGIALLGSGGWGQPAIAIAAGAWYNGIYTPLKRRTAFALIPGALSGALPPAVGWIAGGGTLADPALWALSLFFWVWQIPHFWLLVMRYGTEYSAAGLPSLIERFAPEQLARIIFLWICSTAVSCLLLSLFGFAHTTPVRVLLLIASVSLIAQGGILLYRGTSFSGSAFASVNIYMLTALTLLSSDRLFLSPEVRRGAYAAISAFSANYHFLFL